MISGIDQTNTYVTTAGAAAQAESVDTKAAEKTSEEKKAADSSTASGAVYEKGTTEKKATYSINKMSKEDRSALVQQLKQDQANRQQSLTDLVSKMMGKQASTFGKAGNDDSMWKFIASGNYTVDAKTKAQAQADIAEDGYWGVKQTSQRLFDFASALAGDDVEKMKKMQAAVEKGYKLAEKAWGGSLPGISQDTLSATNKLFEDYYKSKEQTAGIGA